jgi:hypothetical protein
MVTADDLWRASARGHGLRGDHAARAPSAPVGIQNAAMIWMLREQTKVPFLVDAGVGTASDAAIAMELGCDAVLLNSAIAHAKDPIRMAEAMKLAIEAGRLAYLAGRMPRRLGADPSSPLTGLIGSSRSRSSALRTRQRVATHRFPQPPKRRCGGCWPRSTSRIRPASMSCSARKAPTPLDRTEATHLLAAALEAPEYSRSSGCEASAGGLAPRGTRPSCRDRADYGLIDDIGPGNVDHRHFIFIYFIEGAAVSSCPCSLFLDADDGRRAHRICGGAARSAVVPYRAATMRWRNAMRTAHKKSRRPAD